MLEELVYSESDPFIVTLVKPMQKENAQLPMLVTLFGIVTLVKPLHL